jgi:hypothetical protein
MVLESPELLTKTPEVQQMELIPIHPPLVKLVDEDMAE